MTTSQTEQGHDRPKCGARRRQDDGKPCQLPAGWGTDHVGTGPCRKHLGNTPNHEVHAQRIQAEQAALRFGVPIETNTQDALREALNRANGIVAYLLGRVQALSPDAMVAGMERVRRTTRPGDGQGGGQSTEIVEVLKTRPNEWVRLLQWWERRLSGLALDMARLGIEQKQLELSRDQVALMHKVIAAALLQLGGISEDDPRVAEELPQIIMGELERAQ